MGKSFLKNYKIEDKKLSDLEKLQWERYNSHRSYLIIQKHKEEAALFRILILICSGVFSLSLLIGDLHEITHKCFLVLSWSFSLLALILMILGINFSIKSYEKEIECWDETKEECKKNIFTSYLDCIKCFATVFLFISVLFLIIFYSLNL